MNRCTHCGETHGAGNHFCPVTGRSIDLGPRLIGEILLKHYKIITILGEGPIGIILEVEDTKTSKRFAAKLIHPQHTRAGDAADKFLSEAKKAGSLDCSNIAKVYETGRDTGAAPSVVRELMVGQCLEDYINAKGQLPVAEALTITRAILNALKATHGVNVLNLDLSPADVFLDSSSGRTIVKLVDFGEGHIKPTIKLDSGEMPDSHHYYAPEQRRPGWKGDPRADIFATGAVMYHMLTGQAPARIPSPVNSSRSDIGPQLTALIHKALAAAPGNRYQSAGDFIAAVDDVSASLSVAAPAATPGPTPSPNQAVLSSEPTVEPSISEVEISRSKASASMGQMPSRDKADYFDEPTGSDDELAQPTVIVDMPEVAKVAAKKKMLKIAALLGVLLVVVIAVFFLLDGRGEETYQSNEDVMITIQVAPSNAAVIVNGTRVKGNPPTLTVAPNDLFVTIGAKADGYESLEKDVKFDVTKTIILELMEIVAPIEEISPDEKEQPEIEEIINENEDESSLQVKEPAPVIDPIEQVPANIVSPKPVPKKPVPKKPVPKKPVPKKQVPKKMLVKQPEPKKPEPKKPEIKKPVPQKSVPKQPTKPKNKKDGFDVSNPYG